MKAFIFAIIIFLINQSFLYGITNEEYFGKAIDENGKILYFEYHQIKYEKDKTPIESQTTYLSSNGEKLAILKSNYQDSLKLPTYFFHDFKRNYLEGLKKIDNSYYIFKKEKNKKEELVLLEKDYNVFSCQGWHYYLIQNLEKLTKDETIVLKLVLPGKLDFYTFRIEKTTDKNNIIVAKLRADNFFINLFAPTLILTYNKKTRRLENYKGPSNLKSDDDDFKMVEIFYGDHFKNTIKAFLKKK